MYTITKKAIVFHSCKSMFELVDSVENYPDFLKWCGSTKIIKRNNEITIAEIQINFKGISQKFTTKNKKKYPNIMQINLIDGPFKMLTGSWIFKEIEKNSCAIEFKVQYEFKNLLIDSIISPVFKYISNTLIDNFIEKANQSVFEKKK